MGLKASIDFASSILGMRARKMWFILDKIDFEEKDALTASTTSSFNRNQKCW